MTKLLKLPGLIDIHTHLRSPGQTHKEDFYTGTMAAINGGFTTIIDMPNNLIPVTTNKILTEKIEIAKEEIISDLGFHFGSLGDNFEEFPKVKSKVFGLKLYLNHTTGNFIIGKKELEIIYSKWDSHQPILLHAEDDVLDMVFEIIKKTNKKTHICHVSSEIELSKIIKAKERGLPVSCGVTAHHLFLTNEDEKRLGVFGRMKPFLKSKRDVQFLWKHLSYVDIIESDHAPHTIKEKESDAPFGVPGLDTTLPLLVTAFKKGKLTLGDITRLCYTNPAKIFNIKKDSTTYIEVLLEQYKIKKENLKTKCGWSPFEGMEVVGKVSKVVIRGEKVMSGGKIIAKKGSGMIISPEV